ncbi:MAG: NAD(P)H-dependent oxidoreductase [Fibrobacteria bacterium]|nr:NAD(P)H-dependent oxidoreductase [Fibrobacteria bacterium]
MPKPHRILILDGHPDETSLGRALSRAYQEGARASGAETRHVALANLDFDPILRGGFHSKNALEPDLVQAQQDILWAEHIVWVHPVWWSNIPALMKGFVDRVFLPGYAFSYSGASPFPRQLLKGRSSRIIYTQDAPNWYYRWFIGRPSVRSMASGVLKFCGISPVRLTDIGPVRRSSEEKRAEWLRKVERLGMARA